MSDSDGEVIVKNEADSEDNEDEIDEPEKTPADVGHYTLEEKIVAAVWVHERVRNNMTWDIMLRNFRARFKNKPPSKQTLLGWERKLFTTGNAHDKERTGRPIARLMHVPYVQQSIEESPNLSIRERAKELGIPYATLLKILKDDLNMAYVPDELSEKKSSTLTTAGKWKFVENSSNKSKSNRKRKNNDSNKSDVPEIPIESNTFSQQSNSTLSSSSYLYGNSSNSASMQSSSSIQNNYQMFNNETDPMY